MNFFSKILSLLLLISASLYAQQKTVKVQSGISLELANFRHATISNIQYTLAFTIPADKNVDISAQEKISFNLNDTSQPLQLDFKQKPNTIKTIKVGGKTTTIDWQEEHLLINQKLLKKGLNTLEITFSTGNESLNRNDDFLYALFVPEHARTVFPCFDQPDLKANFLLTLTVPKTWKVLANGSKKDSTSTATSTTYQFTNSNKLPTYLFCFTAGKFTDLAKQQGKYNMEFLHRETDSKKIKLSVDSVFKAHEDAVGFLENWTGIRYPFEKIGFVALPDFQFGGMEHPGVVEYKSSSFFLDEGATKDQLIARSTLISHETAHMWFGDLVTMKWFNDVWMKEVFANFMADKVTEKLMGKELFDLKFLQDHYPAAYGVDRTLGANPIRQQLDNLQDAGSMYGNIIYHKAPIMMRQLEIVMGKENFRKGIQEYLRKYAYSNATWNDLIIILSKFTTTDLYEWNKVWVNQPGRPIFDCKVDYTGNKIDKLVLTQNPEVGSKRIWPQTFAITLVYPTTSKNLAVNMNAGKIDVKEAKGLEKPNYIIFNSDGAGYGLFPADAQLTAILFSLQSPLQRASAYINAYENMLANRFFTAPELLKLFTDGISKEKNEMNLRLLTGYITTIYWEFISNKNRAAFSPILEKTIWTAMENETAANNKKNLFNAYQNIYLSDEGSKRIYTIWQSQKAPMGVKLIDDDFTSLALTIALKTDTANSVLQQQLDRTTNIDRKNRLRFLMPALSSNVKERDDFFNSLSDRKNRAKEAFVTTALSYLNHPLRQNTSVKYLPKSLELLVEIKQTGDIFFPQSWLSSIFGNYQNKEAFDIVISFLQKNPDYNPMLRAKILQATDNLRRAQQLVITDK